MPEPDDDHSGTRVLVASSDCYLRSLLAWSLAQDERFEVVGQAKDGDEVLAWSEPFRVVVIDLTIGGLGILGVMRRLQRRSEQVVVVVVGHETVSYLHDALELEGAADYLLLPENVEELSDRISDACRRPIRGLKSGSPALGVATALRQPRRVGRRLGAPSHAQLGE